VAPYLKRVFDVFGRERCYWGTDITGSFAEATFASASLISPRHSIFSPRRIKTG
jgi:hypothetical protein